MFIFRINQHQITGIINLTLLENYAIHFKSKRIISRAYKIFPLFKNEHINRCQFCCFSMSPEKECFNVLHIKPEEQSYLAKNAKLKVYEYYKFIIDSWKDTYGSSIKQDFNIMKQLLKIITIDVSNHIFSEEKLYDYLFLSLIVMSWLKFHSIFLHLYKSEIVNWVIQLKCLINDHVIMIGGERTECLGLIHYIANSYDI